MVYDCFMFNDELDLLELRLRFLHKTVDKFVLVESERTVSGNKKPLHYKSNQSRFREFEDKIIHLIAPAINLSVWEYEFYQRNYIKEGLKQCEPDDIIFITDVDEIIDIPSILADKKLSLPSLIEIKMYYYFLNVETNAKWKFPLICHWKQIENTDIGSRVNYSKNITQNVLFQTEKINGWHFSYLFGSDIKMYQEKIKTFTHQEYNTAHFLNEKRISRCINFKVDLFERPFMKLRVNKSRLSSLLPYINNTPLENLMYKKISLKKYLSPANIFYILHIKYYRRIKYLLVNFFSAKKADNN